MKLSVHLITWNGAEYVPYLFDSLRNQSYKDWEFLIIDNNSTDGMKECMRKELEGFPAPYKFIENSENIGFAPAHNIAVRETSASYFLLLNQDMYLMPDCLEKMVKFLDDHPEAAAVSPRLMRWSIDLNRLNKDSDGLKESFTNKIDALGLKVFRNRRVIEQYTQEEWDVVAPSILCHPEGGSGSDRPWGSPTIIGNSTNIEGDCHGPEYSGPRNDTALEVFGVSGAFPMLRRKAIEEIMYNGGFARNAPRGACEAGRQMFDETYHSYKEDVDLAFRLQSRGWKSFVLLDVVAYHDRAGAGPKEMDDMSAARNKEKQPSWVRYHSYKNHLRTLYKNEYWQNLILDFPWIFWYELKKFAYFLVFDRSALKGLWEVWKTRKDLGMKRSEIRDRRSVRWREVRRWWR